MADIQVSDAGTTVRDGKVTVATGDEWMRRMQELVYLQQYAAIMTALDPSRGFEIR